jgi:hypothetical protein
VAPSYLLPGILVLILIISLLAAFFTWTFGRITSARALVVLASIVLTSTALGAAVIVWAYVNQLPLLEAQAQAFRGHLDYGLTLAIETAFGLILEVPGVAWALAICLIGLRRTSDDKAWLATLLLGGLVPVIGSVLAELFPVMIADALGAVGMPIFAHQQYPLGDPYLVSLPYYAGLVPVVAPVVTGAVTAIWAVHAAWRRRGKRVVVTVVG